MIKLHSIRIENFRSIIEPVTIFFPDKGIIRFRGKNGAGKTSVMEAIYFSFFGESLKQGGTIQSKLTAHPAKVSLLFRVDSSEYKIERTPSSVSLMRLVDGNYHSEGLHTRDINASIIALLGMNAMQFQNAIIMASSARRLADYNENERREFFKSLFDLSWIDSLRARVEADYKRIKASISTNDVERRNATLALDTAKINLANYVSFQEDAHQKYGVELAAITAELEKARLVVSNLPEISEPAYSDTTELTNRLKTLEDNIVELTTQLARLNVHIENSSRHKLTEPKEPADKCFTCGREFDKISYEAALAKYNDELAHVRDKNNQLAQDYHKLEAERARCNSERRLLQDERTQLKLELDKVNSNNKAIEAEYASLSAAHKAHNDRVIWCFKAYEAKLADSPKDFTEYINKAQAEVERITAELVKLEAEAESLAGEFRASEFWYKDALGPNGLKAHITQALFVKLNKALANYSKLFGLAIKFTIDAEATYTKTELIVARADGIIIPYGDLSQGQVTRTQLTLQLGLFDLIAGDRWLLMLIDEPFLGLDDDACSAIMELLPVLAQKRAIFVIDQQLGEFPNTKTYNFELVDKQTILR